MKSFRTTFPVVFFILIAVFFVHPNTASAVTGSWVYSGGGGTVTLNSVTSVGTTVDMSGTYDASGITTNGAGGTITGTTVCVIPYFGSLSTGLFADTYINFGGLGAATSGYPDIFFGNNGYNSSPFWCQNAITGTFHVSFSGIPYTDFLTQNLGFYMIRGSLLSPSIQPTYTGKSTGGYSYLTPNSTSNAGYPTTPLAIDGNKYSLGVDLGNKSLTGGGADLPPTATINAPSNPYTSNKGQYINFSGSGTDPDGDTMMAYQWRDGSCTAGTLLSSQYSFSTNSLAVGTHTIYFKVQDIRGTWSPCVTTTVTITNITAPVTTLYCPATAVVGTPITIGVSAVAPNNANVNTVLSVYDSGAQVCYYGWSGYYCYTGAYVYPTLSPASPTSSGTLQTATYTFQGSPAPTFFQNVSASSMVQPTPPYVYSNAYCSIQVLPASTKIAGSCGSSHYLCTSGSSINNTSSATAYTWTCQGANGGTSASCSEAKPVNGACASTHYSCTAGTSINNVQNGTTWTWGCAGSGGGTTASCSEQGITCTIPLGALSAVPSRVTPGNNSVTLSWNTSGVYTLSNCSIYKDGALLKTLSGKADASCAASGTYVDSAAFTHAAHYLLSCSGSELAPAHVNITPNFANF